MKHTEDCSFFSSLPLPVEWCVEEQCVDYPDALSFMEHYSQKIRSGCAQERVWLLEHKPLYTGGIRAKINDLLDPKRFPVFHTSRGGEYTYHGPGQRIAYIMLDLKRRKQDVHAFVFALESWIIRALSAFDIQGERRKNRIGVWVSHNKFSNNHNSYGEAKIAAIGIKIRHWVSFHGIAINIHPNLDHFSGIVPCGLSEYRVTSLSDLGVNITLSEFDLILRKAFEDIFGETKIL